MTRVAIWPGTDQLSAVEWRRRLLESGAEVTAVIDEGQDELLRPLLIELADCDLADCDLVVSVRPVGDALKLVENGLVIGEVDRSEVVELSTPFAFRTKRAQAVLAVQTGEGPIDLLAVLAGALEPRVFPPSDPVGGDA